MPNARFECPHCGWDLNVPDTNQISTICRLCKRPYLVVEAEAYKNALAATDSDFVIENGVLIKYRGASKDVVIPDGITTLGNNIFDHPEEITSVSIPDGVLCIAGSFKGCSSLTSITIPDSVKNIFNFSFQCCTSLVSVVLPEGLEEIDEWVFSDCHSLIEVKLPASVKTIQRGAFAACKALTNVILPEGLEEIRLHAFDTCRSLESLRIPSSVTEIGDFAFANCEKLSNIDCQNKELLKWHTVIGTPYSKANEAH